jgi:DNA-directed RNA polymerase specialized sigma24 family protein
VSEGDGEAFRRSGPVLDRMKGNRRLRVESPWPEIDSELNTELALVDVVAGRWSPQQAEAVIAQLHGITQADAARTMGISQPAIVSRLKVAGGAAIEELCERFEYLVSSRAGT